MAKALNLSGDWRQSDLSWRESSWSLRPGLWTIPLSHAQKQEEGLANDALGLRVKWVFGKDGTAKKAGVRDGDIIVAVGNNTTSMTEAQFLAYVRLNYPPGDKVRLTLLRSGQREDVMLPLE